MFFQIFLIILGFFAFLFLVFALSNDDFVLLRKNVSLEDLFNLAILTSFFGLFSARLLYVILNPNMKFLNPFVFLLFPYFPGLSLAGGVIGGSFFALFLALRNKMPGARVLDIFSISFLGSFVFSFFIKFLDILIFQKKVFLPDTLNLIFCLIFFSIVVYFFLRSKIKDGTSALFVLIFFSVLGIGQSAISSDSKLLFFLSKESFVFILIFFFSLFILFKKIKLDFKKDLKLKK
ncbi:MAG: prolipoprotein diacylglyceryl transferase [Patescibacteria group bacterium]|nr:prolipoprotein diacylglyceryl transferase [Patescibacteria group bacterium]